MAVVGIGDPSKSTAGLTVAQVVAAIQALPWPKQVTFDRLQRSGGQLGGKQW